jgi:hypothetical protein
MKTAPSNPVAASFRYATSFELTGADAAMQKIAATRSGRNELARAP